MRVRAIDSSNDWEMGKGINDYKVNTLAVAQNIKTRLQSFVGDCFFAKSAGLDWFNLMGSKNIIGLRLAITSVILNTPEVTGVVELSFELSENRSVLIQYSATTVYGRIEREQVLQEV